MSAIIKKLLGGQGYPISRISEAADAVIQNPDLFREVFAGMFVNHPDLSVRCADVIERVTAIQPELLEPFKLDLLKLAHEATDHALRWQLVLLLPRLWLVPDDYDSIFEVFDLYLQDENEVVRMYSMEALARLSRKEKVLHLRGLKVLEDLKENPNLIMRLRAERLYKNLRELEDIP